MAQQNTQGNRSRKYVDPFTHELFDLAYIFFDCMQDERNFARYCTTFRWIDCEAAWNLLTYEFSGSFWELLDDYSRGNLGIEYVIR